MESRWKWLDQSLLNAIDQIFLGPALSKEHTRVYHKWVVLFWNTLFWEESENDSNHPISLTYCFCDFMLIALILDFA